LVGAAALSSYSIYEDPDNAPLAIFGILTDCAGSLGRTPEQMSKLGSLRRGMPDEQTPKMGALYKENDKVLQEGIVP
jgi:hypothetical protein